MTTLQFKTFFWKGSADKFAASLRLKGIVGTVARNYCWGPRNCFSWGWKVVWEE